MIDDYAFKIRYLMSLEIVPYKKWRWFGLATADLSKTIDFEIGNENALYKTPLSYAVQLIKKIKGKI